MGLFILDLFSYFDNTKVGDGVGLFQLQVFWDFCCDWRLAGHGYFATHSICMSGDFPSHSVLDSDTNDSEGVMDSICSELCQHQGEELTWNFSGQTFSIFI